jgi:oligoendopeptidase F
LRAKRRKTRPARPSRTNRLEQRIRELQTRLADAVPRAEAEVLQTKLRELKSKLNESIPIVEVDAGLRRARSRLRNKIHKLEEELAVSIPKPTADA